MVFAWDWKNVSAVGSGVALIGRGVIVRSCWGRLCSQVQDRLRGAGKRIIKL